MAQKHLRAVTEAALAIKVANERLGDRMLVAQESGEIVNDICKAAGLGRTRVYELINEAKARRQPPGL